MVRRSKGGAPFAPNHEHGSGKAVKPVAKQTPFPVRSLARRDEKSKVVLVKSLSSGQSLFLQSSLLSSVFELTVFSCVSIGHQSSRWCDGCVSSALTCHDDGHKQEPGKVRGSPHYFFFVNDFAFFTWPHWQINYQVKIWILSLNTIDKHWLTWWTGRKHKCFRKKETVTVKVTTSITETKVVLLPPVAIEKFYFMILYNWANFYEQ